MNPIKQKVLYHLYSSISNLLYMAIFLTYKLSIFGTVVLVYLYFDNYFSGIKLLAYVIGLFIGALVFNFLEKKSYIIDKISDKAQQYKAYPYLKKYGTDFTEPTIEQFGLKNINMKEYREILQLFDYFIPFVAIYSISLFFFNEFISNYINLKLQLIISASFFLVAYVMVKITDKKRIKNYKYYKNVKKFQKEMSIYHKIEDEKRLKKFNK
ncbi:hypothetical protein [Polaribacter sp. M15]